MKVKEKTVRVEEEVEEEKMKLEVYISRGKVQERGNLPPRLASLGLGLQVTGKTDPQN